MKMRRYFKIMSGKVVNGSLDDDEKIVYNEVISRHSSMKEAHEMFSLLSRENYQHSPLVLILDFGLMGKRQQILGDLCGYNGDGGLFNNRFTDLEPYIILSEHFPECGEIVREDKNSVRVQYNGHEREYKDIEKGIKSFLRHAYAGESCEIAYHAFWHDTTVGRDCDRYRLLATTSMIREQKEYRECKRIISYRTVEKDLWNESSRYDDKNTPKIEMVEI